MNFSERGDTGLFKIFGYVAFGTTGLLIVGIVIYWYVSMGTAGTVLLKNNSQRRKPLLAVE